MAVAALLAAAGCAHLEPRADDIEGRDVYVGPQGYRVDLVRFKAPEGRCWIRVTAPVGGPAGGHTLDCTRTRDGNRTYYNIAFNGSRWTVLGLMADGRAWVRLPSVDGDVDVKRDPSAAVDLRALAEQHDADVKSGYLARLGRFDRAAVEADYRATFDEALRKAQEACGGKVEASLQLDKATDEGLKQWNYGGICGEALEAVTQLCERPSVRDYFTSTPTRFDCVPEAYEGDSPSVFESAGATVTYRMRKSSNVTQNARAVLATLGASEASTRQLTPWGDGSSVGDRVIADALAVCDDGKGGLIVIDKRPVERTDDRFQAGLYVGTRQGVSRVQNEGRSAYNFLEPRYLGNPGGYRFYSGVESNLEKRTCTLRCGTQERTLQMLPADEVKALLGELKLVDPPFTRRPFALLRDTAGTYYYVDTSTLEDRANDFQVWVGKRGKMKRLPLTNALNDTSGAVFTTRQGELRLNLDTEGASAWYVNKARKVLRVVPVEDNYDVIFTQLGIYTRRLGNPCDNF